MPRFFKLIAVLVLALAAPLHADDGELVIAAYNAENMFDVFDNPYTDDEGTDVKPRGEIEDIAAALRGIDADVVAFCEVENQGILQALVNEFLGDMGYHHVAVTPTNDGRGINLGVISRYPIDSVTSYRFRELTLPGDDRAWRFARDLMHTRLALPGDRTLDLFSVHFKSKRDSAGDPNSATWRLAEATAAADIIQNVMTHHPDRWIAMVGDFNDTPGSPPLDALTGVGLIDAHASLPDAQRITYLREPYRSTIDYILVNRPMRSAMTDATVPSDPDLLAGSDHAPVVATFRLPE